MQRVDFIWLEQRHIFRVGDKIKFDLGCGVNLQETFTGVDKRGLEKDIIVHDLETFPWPMEDDSSSVILASHIIEHIDPSFSIDFINECWRVLELNGLLVVIVPYAGSDGFYQDPTHKNPWNRFTPFYFIPGNDLFRVYHPKQWKLESMNYNFQSEMGFALRKIENVTEEEEAEIRKKWQHVTMASLPTQPDMVVERRRKVSI